MGRFRNLLCHKGLKVYASMLCREPASVGTCVPLPMECSKAGCTLEGMNSYLFMNCFYRKLSSSN